MLNQNQIDKLMQSIQAGEDTYVYYVAHMIETREGIVDEHLYKSVSQFKVVKIQITDIVNAYWEYSNWVASGGEGYHIETETEYYDEFSKYTHFYTVKDGDDKYSLDINPRFPSIIYGYRREFVDRYGVTHEYTDTSPVHAVYENTLEYGDMVIGDVTSEWNKGNLDWKYRKLDPPATVDGIDFSYVTSDWYILTCKDYPTVEKPLISTKEKSAYFTDLEEAFRYIDQLVA